MKIVGKPRAIRTGMTCFVAGWWWMAKQKHTPASSRQRFCTARSASTLTPRRSRTSADPRPVRERLPCLATTAPAPAATMAAAVETLNVFGAQDIIQSRH